LVLELLLGKLALQGLMVLLPAENRFAWLPPVVLLLAGGMAGLSGMFGLVRVSAARFGLYLVTFGFFGLTGVLLPTAQRAMVWPGGEPVNWGAGGVLFSLFLLAQLFGGSLYARLFCAASPQAARRGVAMAILFKSLAALLLLWFLARSIQIMDLQVLENIANRPDGLLHLMATSMGALPYGLVVGGIGMLLVATLELAVATAAGTVLAAVNRSAPGWRFGCTGSVFGLFLGLLFLPEADAVLTQMYGFWCATTLVAFLIALQRGKVPGQGLRINAFLLGGFVYGAAVVQKSPGDPLWWGIAGSLLGAVLGSGSDFFVGRHRAPKETL